MRGVVMFTIAIKFRVGDGEVSFERFAALLSMSCFNLFKTKFDRIQVHQYSGRWWCVRKLPAQRKRSLAHSASERLDGCSA